MTKLKKTFLSAHRRKNIPAFLLLLILIPLFLWGYPYISNKLYYEAYRYIPSVKPYPPEEDIKIQDITEGHRTSSYTCRPFECSAHQEFYIESCNIKVYSGKPHGVAPNTSTSVPENNLCEIFTRWMEKDGRIKVTTPSPELPYIKINFSVFNDYVNEVEVYFYDSDGQNTKTPGYIENGFIHRSQKYINSFFIFDYMLKKIMDAYK